MPQDEEMTKDVREEAEMFLGIRNFFVKIKNSRLFRAFRKSQLNPHHIGKPVIKAETLEEAKKIMRDNAKKAKEEGKKVRTQFVYNGVRYFIDRDCPPAQEYAEDGIVCRDAVDVSDRIPRNKEGKLDLFAEDPLMVVINPFEGPSLIGHSCMQFHDKVVNRLLPSIHTDALRPKYGRHAEYFFVYPSEIGINPKKLEREMEKHDILHMDDRYDPFFNNCAQNMARVLKKVGVKDFDFYGPDFLGVSYATPGNNPFNKGIRAWCLKHGIRVHANEADEFNRRFPVENVSKNREEMRTKKARYDILKNRLGNNKSRGI